MYQQFNGTQNSRREGRYYPPCTCLSANAAGTSPVLGVVGTREEWWPQLQRLWKCRGRKPTSALGRESLQEGALSLLLRGKPFYPENWNGKRWGNCTKDREQCGQQGRQSVGVLQGDGVSLQPGSQGKGRNEAGEGDGPQPGRS